MNENPQECFTSSYPWHVKRYDDNLFGHISGRCKDMGKYSSEEKHKKPWLLKRIIGVGDSILNSNTS